jgi:hypothetical protein
MGEEHIGIFQISDGKSLTHSSFLFIAEETLYVAAKSGFQGLLFIEKSSDIMDTYLKVYGQHVAVDSYNTIFKKFHSGEKK